MSEEQRQLVIKEIVDTERAYCKSLRIIVDVFENPIKNWKAAGLKYELLPPDVADTIFGNISQIMTVHSQFLRDIEKARKNNESLGPSFQTFAPVFKLWYVDYVDKFTENMNYCERLEGELPNFKNYLDNTLADPVCKGLPLQAYLIMPVQRIPRYRLLLQEVLKQTPADHEDIVPLNKALEEMKKVAEFCDQSIKRREENQVLWDLSRRIKGIDDLVLPHRRYIREGPMKKLNRSGFKDYYMFLFNDILIYGKAYGAKDEKGKYKSYKHHMTMSLINIFARNFEDPKVPSADDRDIWVAAICSAIIIAKSTVAGMEAAAAPLNFASFKAVLKSSRTINSDAPDRGGEMAESSSLGKMLGPDRMRLESNMTESSLLSPRESSLEPDFDYADTETADSLSPDPRSPFSAIPSPPATPTSVKLRSASAERRALPAIPVVSTVASADGMKSPSAPRSPATSSYGEGAIVSEATLALTQARLAKVGVASTDSGETEEAAAMTSPRKAPPLPMSNKNRPLPSRPESLPGSPSSGSAAMEVTSSDATTPRESIKTGPSFADPGVRGDLSKRLATSPISSESSGARSPPPFTKATPLPMSKPVSVSLSPSIAGDMAGAGVVKHMSEGFARPLPVPGAKAAPPPFVRKITSKDPIADMSKMTALEIPASSEVAKPGPVSPPPYTKKAEGSGPAKLNAGGRSGTPPPSQAGRIPARVESSASHSVKELLAGLELNEYFDLFKSEGYDRWDSFKLLSISDMKEMGVKQGHGKLIAAKILELTADPT